MQSIPSASHSASVHVPAGSGQQDSSLGVHGTSQELSSGAVTVQMHSTPTLLPVQESTFLFGLLHSGAAPPEDGAQDA